MKTLFYDDFRFTLELLNPEFSQLRQSQVEGSLRHKQRGIDLGKRVILKFEENPGKGGIELTIVPANAKSWEEITGIRGRISEEAYTSIENLGMSQRWYNCNPKIKVRVVSRYTE